MEAPDQDLRRLDEPRGFTQNERALLDQLLAEDFVERDVLRQQLTGACVTAEGRHDSRTIRLRLPDDAPRAATKLRVPVEGETADVDDVPIVVLLHVVDGYVDELEIYRVDGGEIQDPVTTGCLRVTVNEGPE